VSFEPTQVSYPHQPGAASCQSCEIPQVDATNLPAIPEPGATRYQNLMRQKSRFDPEVARPHPPCALIPQQNSGLDERRRKTSAEAGAGKRVR
jgi:hypothetical protein